MNNEKLFITMVEKLEKLLHFPQDSFTVKQDNRIRGLSIALYNYIDGKKEKCYLLTYNNKKILNKLEMLMGILHEMGHIRLKHLETNSYLSLTKMEYQAEAFALDVIKKYYKEYYLRAIDYLLKYVDGPDLIYAIAFQCLHDERIEELNAKK